MKTRKISKLWYQTRNLGNEVALPVKFHELYEIQSFTNKWIGSPRLVSRYRILVVDDKNLIYDLECISINQQTLAHHLSKGAFCVSFTFVTFQIFSLHGKSPSR